MKKILLLFVNIVLLGCASYTFADYPIVGYSYLADPGAIWHEGRLYIYCSNDNENPIGGSTYDMSSIVCVSSSDLKNWTDHGIVFDVPKNAAWTKLSWAPSPAYKNGKFYLYYGNGGSAIGVAVSDSPTGPFVDPVGRSIASGSTPGVQPFNGWLFDPMTFVDDDGKAYMYFGGNGEDNMRVATLNDNMISINGNVKKFTVPYLFEAAWVHKYKGTYYFSYSTNPANGMRIDYMTSNNPTSGFTYRGVLSAQPPINNNNNHQAIVEINGQWYQVYHNRIVARDNLGTAEMPYHRNLAIDAFSHNADGTIKQMVNTVDGVKQLKYLDPFIRQEGETMSDQKGINTVANPAGGMALGQIDNGDWIMVEGVDFGSGASSVSVRVGSPSGGTIEIRTGSPTGTLAGTVQVPNTGGYLTWKTVTTSVNNLSGVKKLYFVFPKGGFNLDYWQFENGGPKVSLITPLENARYAAPISIPIDVDVSVSNGTIAHVDYYLNDKLIQEEWVAPYAFDHVINIAGEYTIKAIAYDSNNNTAQDEIVITVLPKQEAYGGTSHIIPGIIQFENYDIGGNGFAYHDDSDGNTGEASFRIDEDVDIEVCTDIGAGYNIGFATAGEWLEYTVNVAKAGKYSIKFRVACKGDDRTISLSADGKPLITDIAIPNTTEWQAWEDVEVKEIELKAGIQVLRLTIGATDYVNLNYMSIVPLTIPTTSVFQLKKGWNLVGYPLSNSSNIEDALASIWPNVITVKNHDAFYQKSGTPALNLLLKLEYGKGYYIKVDKDCKLEWIK